LKDLAAQREMLNRAAVEVKERRTKLRDELVNLLKKYTVADLRTSITPGNVIDIDGSLKPIEGFEILLQNNIEAAPVYTLTPTGQKEYSGFLDIRDLLSSVVYVYTQPIDEDSLVFTRDGGAEVDFVPSTHGLDGLADIHEIYNHLIPAAPPGGGPSTPEDPEKTGAGGEETDFAAPLPPIVPHVVVPGNEEEAEDTVGEFPTILPGGTPRGRGSHSHSPRSDSPRRLDADCARTTSTMSLKTANEAADGQPEGGSPPASVAATRWEETIRRGMQKFSLASPPAAAVANGSLSPVDEAANMSGYGSTALSTDGTGGGRAAFKEQAMITLTYLSRRNPFKPVTANTSLLTVAELFARGQRRIPVVDPGTDSASVSSDHGDDSKGEYKSSEFMSRLPIVDIISQVTFVEFLLAHANELMSIMAAEVDPCDVGTRNVATVDATQSTALDAFALMDELRLTGLAIVGQNYKMLGATSSRDIKRLAMNKGKLSLDLPLIDYLMKSRNSVGLGEGSREASEATMKTLSDGKPETNVADFEDKQALLFQLVGSLCLPIKGSTIGDVIRALSRSNTNRVFFIDHDQEPVRVMSFRDIMRLVVE